MPMRRVEDEAFADAGAEPARDGAERRLAERERDGKEEQQVDLAEVAVRDGGVDQAAENQRRRRGDDRREDDAQ